MYNMASVSVKYHWFVSIFIVIYYGNAIRFVSVLLLSSSSSPFSSCVWIHFIYFRHFIPNPNKCTVAFHLQRAACCCNEPQHQLIEENFQWHNETCGRFFVCSISDNFMSVLRSCFGLCVWLFFFVFFFGFFFFFRNQKN